MTWIIGTASQYGFSILVSDICVTFTDVDGTKRHVDCLQKIYLLGRFVIGGFAGSVRIGFDTLDRLRREFATVPNGTALDINIGAHTWLCRVIRRVFRAAPESERNLGSSIILASAHPNKNRGDLPCPWTDIHVFSSPNFEPVVAGPMEAVAIGKSVAVSVYMDAIRTLCANSGLAQAAMGDEGRQASLLAHMVSTTLADGPILGVSTMFQFGLITRNKYAIHNHEYAVRERDGRKIEYTFPRIARGAEEFETLSRELSCRADAAKC